MGLPNNYAKQEPQLERRWDSLNDLKYYKVTYDLYLEEDFFNKIKEEGDDTDEWEMNQELGITESPMGRGGYGPPNTRHLVKYGIKTFAALDEEKAKATFKGWVDSMVSQKIIEELTIIDFMENTLMEELDRLDVLPILKLNGES
jgi:hypothetical protein